MGIKFIKDGVEYDAQGGLIQKRNETIFPLSYTLDAGGTFETYTIPSSASNHIIGLSGYTTFNVEFPTPNVTSTVYVQYAGQTRQISRNGSTTLLPGVCDGYAAMYTLSNATEIYFEAATDYDALTNRPRLNGSVISGPGASRKYSLVELEYKNFTTPVPPNDPDYTTSTLATVSIATRDLAEWRLANSYTTDQSTALSGSSTALSNITDNTIVRSATRPTWYDGTTYKELATRQEVLNLTTSDNIIDTLIYTRATVAEMDAISDALVGDTCLCLATDIVYDCTALTGTVPTWTARTALTYNNGDYYMVVDVDGQTGGRAIWVGNTTNGVFKIVKDMVNSVDGVTISRNTDRELTVLKTPQSLTLRKLDAAGSPITSETKVFDGSVATTFDIVPTTPDGVTIDLNASGELEVIKVPTDDVTINTPTSGANAGKLTVLKVPNALTVNTKDASGTTTAVTYDGGSAVTINAISGVATDNVTITVPTSGTYANELTVLKVPNTLSLSHKYIDGTDVEATPVTFVGDTTVAFTVDAPLSTDATASLTKDNVNAKNVLKVLKVPNSLTIVRKDVAGTQISSDTFDGGAAKTVEALDLSYDSTLSTVTGTPSKLHVVKVPHALELEYYKPDVSTATLLTFDGSASVQSTIDLRGMVRKGASDTYLTYANSSTTGPVDTTEIQYHPSNAPLSLKDKLDAQDTALATHIADATNPHDVTLQQAANEQALAGTKTVTLGTGVKLYEGTAVAAGAKYQTLTEIEAIIQGLAREGGPALAWGVDGVVVSKDDLKGTGAAAAPNYPYVVSTGDLVGDHAAGATYEATAVAADGTVTWASYTQPVADAPGLFYNIIHWYGEFYGHYCSANNARISCRDAGGGSLVWDLVVFDSQITAGSITFDKLADLTQTSNADTLSVALGEAFGRVVPAFNAKGLHISNVVTAITITGPLGDDTEDWVN